MPLTDEFVAVNEEPNEYIQDVIIYQCDACGLVQNPCDFNHETYYEKYEYSAGHSRFTQNFMHAYADVVCGLFQSVNSRPPSAVLEIGSGDGEQLAAFQAVGVERVLGVEPSEELVRRSKRRGVHAQKGFFSSELLSEIGDQKFDVCVSSYTLDHIRDPSDYLNAAHKLLTPQGVLAFEVHDLAQITKRGEWCLFEHEHTVYLDANSARSIVSSHGFNVHTINPLPNRLVRANSLILIAYKSSADISPPKAIQADYGSLQDRINKVIQKIDKWISCLPPEDTLVGYGAGGRGIMTLAALIQSNRFATIFDSTYTSGRFKTPKTHIPVSGPDDLALHKHAWCLVFSFGYITEITDALVSAGYQRERIVSLESFFQ